MKFVYSHFLKAVFSMLFRGKYTIGMDSVTF